MKDQYLISNKTYYFQYKILYITSWLKFTIATIALSCWILFTNVIISFVNSIDRLMMQGPNCLIHYVKNMQNKWKSFLSISITCIFNYTELTWNTCRPRNIMYKFCIFTFNTTYERKNNIIKIILDFKKYRSLIVICFEMNIRSIKINL